MPYDIHKLYWIREILNDWANWLGHGGGYPHESNIEMCRNGTGSGVFGSRVPLDVEPSLSVARASIAMQHLRLLDGAAAELLTKFYLKKAKTRVPELAEEAGVGLTVYQTQRRLAEQKFLGLYQALLPPDEG